MQAHRYPTGRRAWARAQLVRGSSAGATWEISAEYPEARLTLGTDPSAGWPIQASGVQPVHCELFWDGTALWVGDTHGAGGVFLDGQRVSDWVQIQGPAELRFGAAALDIETSPPEQQQMASRPDEAPSVTRVDMLLPSESARGGGPIFGGAASDDSIPDLDGDATRVVASPLERPPVADVLADLRPRLGGDNQAPGAAEATRMVALPPAAPAPAVPPPRPTKDVRPPSAPPSPNPPSAAPPPPEEPVASAAATPPAAGAPAFAPPPAAPEAPATKSKFGPLLDRLGPLLEKLKPESSAEVVDASGGKKGQSLPTRTWIMLAVTLVAAVGLLLWEEEPPESVPPPPPSAAAAPNSAATPAESPGTPEPTAANGPPAEPVAAPTTAEEPEPVELIADEGQGTLQRRAADHYIAGRYVEALTYYRRLAQIDPTSAAYATMVRILERLTQCQNGVGPGGEPCRPH